MAMFISYFPQLCTSVSFLEALSSGFCTEMWRILAVFLVHTHLVVQKTGQ